MLFLECDQPWLTPARLCTSFFTGVIEAYFLRPEAGRPAARGSLVLSEVRGVLLSAAKVKVVFEGGPGKIRLTQEWNGGGN
jgi:hypothetical protein